MRWRFSTEEFAWTILALLFHAQIFFSHELPANPSARSFLQDWRWSNVGGCASNQYVHCRQWSTVLEGWVWLIRVCQKTPIFTRNWTTSEFGAKGYANQKETHPGETVVFAGFLVPEELQFETHSTLQENYLRHKNSTGKLRIATLKEVEQQQLRRNQ